MGSDTSGCSSSNERTAKKVEKKKKNKRTNNKPYAQKYNSAWDVDPDFKRWITRSAKGNNYFHCKICAEDLTTVGGRSNLVKHQAGGKHKTNAKAVTENQPAISDCFQKSTLLAQRVKEAEIRLCTFITEHNISFSVVDHLVPLIQKIGTDPEVVKLITCGRTKCTQIVKNVTGASGFETIVEFLRDGKFSISVDESTDVSSVKHLVIVARYFDGNCICDQFLGLVPVADATAQSLYNCLVAFFTENDISYKTNLIGFASDGASNMFGVNHSLAVLLGKDIPHLFTMKCICHSFALCASYACATLPRIIEDICRDVYNYLSNSYKRLQEYKSFQALLEIKPHKLLQLCQTRWLSLLPVVKRLLEQYDALILFFEKAATTDKILSAETILVRLKDPSMKMYLQFLEFVIPFFHKLNAEMQAEDAKIHMLYDKVAAVFKSLLEFFMKPDYLRKTKLEDINVHPHFYLQLEDVYLGATLTAVLFKNTHGVNPDLIAHLRTRCLAFYVEGTKQIQKRFNFRDPRVKIIKMISVLDPSNFKKVDATPTATSIVPLACSFPNLIEEKNLNDLDAEWRELRNLKLPSESESSSTCKFWVMVHKMTCGDGTQKFPLLSKFALNVLSLPRSSANAERVLSQVNLIKTKTRNRMDTPTLKGVLYTKALLSDYSCFNFPVSRDLIKRHNDTMYEQPKV